MDGKSDAFMGQNRGTRASVDGPPRQSQPYEHQNTHKQPRVQGGYKEFTCNNYNSGYCRESQDHFDPILSHRNTSTPARTAMAIQPFPLGISVIRPSIAQHRPIRGLTTALADRGQRTDGHLLRDIVRFCRNNFAWETHRKYTLKEGVHVVTTHS